MSTVRLRSGHVQPVWAGHPWVFAQAIDRVEGAPAPGSVVKVVDPGGTFLGKGYWSPKSAIPVRILGRSPEDSLEAGWLGARIERARALRQEILGLPAAETTGYRLVSSEGDGLGGLVVDIYDRVAVVQLGTLGMKLRAEEIFGHVERVAGVETVVEVATDLSAVEGFASEGGVVRGVPHDALRFRERGLRFEIGADITQKTGFYFDQREHRARVESMARGRRVLDVYAFVGAFGMAAARGGAASVRCVDSSSAAMTAAAIMAHQNGLSDRMTFENENAKHALSRYAARSERFGMVIVDPPKLAPTKRHLDQARKAYRALNANALRLVEPGGVLVSCSCSGVLSREDFQRTLALAAKDAERELTLLHLGEQAPDHPILPAFPQGSYLKTAFLRAG